MRHRARPAWIAAAALLFIAAAAGAQPTAQAGRIKVVFGEAFVVGANGPVRAQVGQVVHEADVIRTGRDGRIGLTLNDETRLSLGPGSEIRLDRFQYAPAEGRLGLVLRVIRGIATYVSGRIAKISPDSIRIETPSSIIGVRGTRLAIQVGPHPGS
jgi:hypothetical protein